MGSELLADLSQWPGRLRASSTLLLVLPGAPSPSQTPTPFCRLSPSISSSLKLLQIPWQTGLFPTLWMPQLLEWTLSLLSLVMYVSFEAVSSMGQELCPVRLQAQQ